MNQTEPGTRVPVGTCDVVFITLDCLRYDVARDAAARGETPNLSALLPGGRWQKRHSPGSFTFAAHGAFFAGFLPTPARPGKHPRRFALSFPGSETTGEQTHVFHTPDIVAGFRCRGYHTLCVGGVGFFNKLTPLASVLPGLFDASHWREEFGVTDPESTRHQVAWAVEQIDALPRQRRLFLFLNVSAIHQPNCFYLEGATEDTLESHAAALRYVDRQLPALFDALRRRAPTFAIVCSDHGTTYGEDGYTGHRLAHPNVWTVPYADFFLERE